MAKNIFQNLMYQIKEIVNKELGIIDEAGDIIACSDESKIGQSFSQIDKILSNKQQSLVLDGFTFFKINIKEKVEFMAFIESEEAEYLKYLSLIAINIVNTKNFYDEKYDKTNFLKSILNENILPGEITIKAKDLRIAYNSFRTVFLIKTVKTKDISVFEAVQELFPNKTKDFVLVLDDENIIFIKEFKSSEDSKEIKKTANIIIDTLNTELMVKAYIGIGTMVDNLTELGRSYKEAHTALTVGNIFDTDKYIISYENLGLGRLIYKIPDNLCRLFLKEVFKNGSYESLDSEYLLTIQKFFENNLNVSETSRQMFVHRNTLVYRLDKIQKATGLDLTKFDDAIILKFAMLVNKYLDRGNKTM